MAFNYANDTVVAFPSNVRTRLVEGIAAA